MAPGDLIYFKIRVRLFKAYSGNDYYLIPAEEKFIVLGNVFFNDFSKVKEVKLYSIKKQVVGFNNLLEQIFYLKKAKNEV